MRFVKSIEFKEEQCENISSIFVTLIVLKLDKSRNDNEEHFKNIPNIFLTFFVIKVDKFNEDKEEQYENILFISVTSFVLKLHKSKNIKFLHDENIKLVFVNNLLKINLKVYSPFFSNLYLKLNFILWLFKNNSHESSISFLFNSQQFKICISLFISSDLIEYDAII